MNRKFILFDMDGVLLSPEGYKHALIESVKRVGQALGMPHVSLSEAQIARFETLSVTNEWDTLAICTAIMLIEIWQENPSIRYTGEISQTSQESTTILPKFDYFLSKFPGDGDLPGHEACEIILRENPSLNNSQKFHLTDILFNCRDIYQSLTLPLHLERVLGSGLYKDYYGLEPQLNTESFLLKYDRPSISEEQKLSLSTWLASPPHFAGILTNRPNRTPKQFISAPEAELGVKLIDMKYLPILGSGTLGWYSENYQGNEAHTFLKPNPVHSLALLQLCLGLDSYNAIKIAVNLLQNIGNQDNWHQFDGDKIIIFEDSAKGLISARLAVDILQDRGVNLDLLCVGVSNNPIKIKALEPHANIIIENINQINWDSL
ncbi:MAG: hypothetical protein P1P73_06955 [Brevefilum sp.]|nr:hypothetical protein [Brevefilum sp.]